jgi:hypothetical protein
MNDTAIERIKSQILERVNQETNKLICSEEETNALISRVREQLCQGVERMKDSGLFTANEYLEVSEYYDSLLRGRRDDILSDLKRRERESFQFFM